ncbi:FAD binding domain-containing protein [Streptomyces chartreusis]|uniref:FAD binding domain-containing protein n=1 Tax=Streptomyces chartreusis TaxID=1969 RepID=UPI002E17F0D7|nr:FAD binding domain-containing protein [Streptomyces chartreusis]
MDLNTITEVIRRPSERPGRDWHEGDAWLAGGTWLYSTEQPDLRRLIDLTALRWDPLVPTDEGLEIGATCTIRDLYAFPWPQRWTAGPLFRASCEAFLSSFKVWNSATVGGNICMSLPAGPMITATVALEARYELWAPDGSVRFVDALDFVTGDHRNILAPGEILRRITVPERALRQRTSRRRFTLTRLGRSTVFLVGTQRPEAENLLLTLTAGTTRPIRIAFDALPAGGTLRESIEAVPADVWYADPNGTPEHRRHLTRHFAEEIRRELMDGDLP